MSNLLWAFEKIEKCSECCAECYKWGGKSFPWTRRLTPGENTASFSFFFLWKMLFFSLVTNVNMWKIVALLLIGFPPGGRVNIWRVCLLWLFFFKWSRSDSKLAPRFFQNTHFFFLQAAAGVGWWTRFLTLWRASSLEPPCPTRPTMGKHLTSLMGSHFLSLIEQGHLDVSSFSVVTFFLLFIFFKTIILMCSEIYSTPH